MENIKQRIIYPKIFSFNKNDGLISSIENFSKDKPIIMEWNSKGNSPYILFDFGEKVSAIVVPEENANGLDEKALIDFCKKNLAGYKCPKAVFFRQELPRNAMGKIQKQVLQAEYSTD